MADWPGFLDTVNLGKVRFARELNSRLKAKTTHFWQDHAVSQDLVDNGTRMRATELLADVHGLRKSEVSVSGNLVVSTAAEMSPEDRRKWLDEHFDEIAKARGYRKPDEP